jgi:acetyl-CoA carboxylase biotin carboxylase subunit/3-methylcrotonyl-CoA carboxylase alpha subunit
MLDAFGDKMKARHVALAAGVSPVPGVDAPIDLATPEGREAAGAAAERIGYPILVKAVGGGGGIGMQIVREAAGLEKALETCANRGAAAFADARVYLERYVAQPRHIEVQVFGDTHGQIFALGERECSLQRRHQKIVEESPSSAWFLQGAEGALRREKLLASAVRIVREVSYVNAGTCEFIADDQGEVFFLEVNARLQVEHPVTELVTGLDLVEWQLRVAAGEKLPDWSELDRKGHAIEARLYAEDPAKGFLPKPGPIDTLRWCGGEGELQTPHVRIESGVAPGNKMTPYYDPMLAKVVTWGETREQAMDRLADALATTEVAPCVTNANYLCAVLANEDFRAGRYDTQFAEPFARAWATAHA